MDDHDPFNMFGFNLQSDPEFLLGDSNEVFSEWMSQMGSPGAETSGTQLTSDSSYSAIVGLDYEDLAMPLDAPVETASTPPIKIQEEVEEPGMELLNRTPTMSGMLPDDTDLPQDSQDNNTVGSDDPLARIDKAYKLKCDLKDKLTLTTDSYLRSLLERSVDICDMILEQEQPTRPRNTIHSAWNQDKIPYGEEKGDQVPSLSKSKRRFDQFEDDETDTQDVKARKDSGLASTAPTQDTKQEPCPKLLIYCGHQYGNKICQHEKLYASRSEFISSHVKRNHLLSFKCGCCEDACEKHKATMLEHLVKGVSGRLDSAEIQAKVKELEARRLGDTKDKPRILEWESTIPNGECRDTIKTCIQIRDYTGRTADWQKDVKVKMNKDDKASTNTYNYENEWKTGEWMDALVKIQFVDEDRAKRKKRTAKASSSIAAT